MDKEIEYIKVTGRVSIDITEQVQTRTFRLYSTLYLAA